MKADDPSHRMAIRNAFDYHDLIGSIPLADTESRAEPWDMWVDVEMGRRCWRGEGLEGTMA